MKLPRISSEADRAVRAVERCYVICEVNWKKSGDDTTKLFIAGKFRKEFKRSFRCAGRSGSHIHRGYLASSSNLPRTKTRTTTIRTTFKHNNNVQRNTESIPLSAVTSVQQNEKHE